jgi:hypothetical protein
MPVSEQILKIELRMIERIGVDMEDMGDCDPWSTTSLRILDNHITRMLNKAIGGLLMSDLVKALAALRVGERAGWWRLVARCKSSGGGR